MKNKQIRFVVVALFVVSLLAISVNVVPAQDIREECAAEIDWTPTYPEFTPYDPVVTIETPFPASADFIGDDTFTDNPMYNRVLENLGIQYEIAWQSNDDTQLQTAIASGNLPDMFAAGGTGGAATAQLSLLIENGAIADITDIWEEVASELTIDRKNYPDDDTWVSITRDGRIYGIAFTYGPAYNIDNLGFIRQDWLDEVGLPMPTTIEELETAMRAFIDAGLTTYGINANQALVTWYMSLDPIFGAYGAMPQTWVENEDGTLRYSSLDEGTRAALETLQRWYADGLMDPDFFTYGQGDSAAVVMAEQVGVWFAPWWSVGTITLPLTEQNPDAEIALLPPIVGPDGESGRKASPTRGAAVVFREGVDESVIRAAIEQLNWQIDMHVNWEEYQQYGEWRNSHAFAEGYEWVFDEDCVMQRGPVDNSYAYVNEVGTGFPFITYPSYQADVFADMAAWAEADPETLNNAQEYLLRNPQVLLEVEYYNTIVDRLDNAIVDRYLGANTETMTDVMPDLNTLESTYFIEIITGTRPIEDFDEFVSEWLASGGEQVIEDVNAWFTSQ